MGQRTSRFSFGDRRSFYFHTLIKSTFPVNKGLLCFYDKQNITWLLVDMKLLFSCSTRHLTRSLHLRVSYRVKHSKRNSTFTRAHILFSIYCMNFHLSMIPSKEPKISNNFNRLIILNAISNGPHLVCRHRSTGTGCD